MAAPKRRSRGSLKGSGQVALERQCLQAKIRLFGASAPLSVTPATLALVTAAFAPVVLTPRVVTPGKLSLVLTTFAPTVAAPRLVTPGKLSLTLSTFAPTVATPRLAIPGQLALVLTTFAPTVNLPLSANVTPGTSQLRLTGFPPDVQGDLHGGEFGHVVSDTARKMRFGIGADESPEPILVSPSAGRLTVQGYPPTLARGSAVAFTLEEIATLASEVSEEELVALLAA